MIIGSSLTVENRSRFRAKLYKVGLGSPLSGTVIKGYMDLTVGLNQMSCQYSRSTVFVLGRSPSEAEGRPFGMS